MRVRFAPSPTGYLHVGNARIALLNWLWARSEGGAFLLRYDDTDEVRSAEKYTQAIAQDLRWMGLAWDGQFRQSQRLQSYHEVADKLRTEGFLYPCYETPQELSLKRRTALAQGRPPRYDRSALRLSSAARRSLEAGGRKPHWRFLLKAPREIVWQDALRGRVGFRIEDLSDPVLVRADGRPLYGLSSVVDDAAMDITHVLRGEDHVANSATQIALFRALGASIPTFAHIPLLVAKDGSPLAKRLEDGSSVARMRVQGIEPQSLVAYLAALGTSEKPVVAFSLLGLLQDLAHGFDVAQFSRASAKFDLWALKSANARLIRSAPYTFAKSRVEDLDPALWTAVRGNIATFAEISIWQRICTRSLVVGSSSSSDAKFLREALTLLPSEPWDKTTWRRWTQSLSAVSGRKGKRLYLPLRTALTGKTQGPEMSELLPVMGLPLVRDRLSSASGNST